MNIINAVTIGKLIAAHREGDEEKFRAYFPRRCWLLRININHKLIDQNHKSGIM